MRSACRASGRVAAAGGICARLRDAMIEPASRVLDIGCGDGALLAYLAREKGVDGRGIELSQSGVNACVGTGCRSSRATPTDLDVSTPAPSMSWSVSQTLQATRRPRHVVEAAAAHRQAGDRLVSEFRLLAHPSGACCSTAGCRSRNLLANGTTRPISISARSAISKTWPPSLGSRSSGRWSWTRAVRSRR